LEKDKINILLLEDNPDDILLLKQALKKSGMEVMLNVTSSLPEFTSFIQNGLDSTDIIISDYNLPAFTGLDALKVLREEDPIIPFFFLTGFLGEEKAVEVMRHGANDFLLKDNVSNAPKIILQLLEEAKLRQESARYQAELLYRNGILSTLMESAVDLIFLKDLEGNLIEVNEGFCRFFGKTQEELIGKNINTLFSSDIMDQILATDEEVLKKEEPVILEMDYHNNGKRYVFESIKTPLKDEDGKNIGFVDVTRDITKKKLDDEALRTSQQLLRQSEKQSLSGSFEYNVQKGKLFCSQQFMKNLGFDQEIKKISYEEFLDRINEAEREIFEYELKRAIRENSEFYMEHRCTRKNDKKVIHCKTYLVPDRKRSKEGYYFGILTDVTKDRQLRKSMLDIQEKERKTIASNLHDSLGQKLVASKMFLSQLEDDSAGTLLRASKLIDQSIDEIRSLSKNLSLYTIQGLGLKSAIEDVMSTFPESTITEYELNFDEIELSDELSTQIYRIVQEGITNILKYAKASEVSLSLNRETHFLNLIISDNGIGFDASTEYSGNGLKNIRERVARCSGFLEIISGNKGTTLKIKVPVK
tara:strand:+ start:23343 stop:25103 length:1761 start_codon:yes stop_codon:yes gene_type:complete